jgi:GT2 family glycosyltransferase
MNNTIGIVTVLYDSEDVVDDFFISLARQTDVAFRLYVVDNSATQTALDRCRALARDHVITAEFVFNNANVGVAKGNNQGIAMARRDGCRYVLLANNDTEFAAGTLSALLRPLLDGESVATPKILYHGPERLVWYAGGRIDAWTMRTPHIGMHDVDAGQFDAPCHTDYAPTCFLLLDVAVFERIGVMDERYFVYYDDTDFVWRLTHAGWRIRYVPDAMVQHKVSSSTGGECSPFTLYYTNRNRIYFIRKNFIGVHKAIALGYVLLTRLLNAARLSKPQAGRLWAGVKDGLRLSVGRDAA